MYGKICSKCNEPYLSDVVKIVGDSSAQMCYSCLRISQSTKDMGRLTEKTIGSFKYDLKNYKHKDNEFNDYDAFFAFSNAVKRLGELEDANEPKPIEEWHEEYGDCLWWFFPIVEPPYCGSPLAVDFPDYVTHFTRLILPIQSK